MKLGLPEVIEKMTEALNASFGVDPNAKRAVKK
jgi:hypothetical protein